MNLADGGPRDGTSPETPAPTSTSQPPDARDPEAPVPIPRCQWGPGYFRPSGEQMPTEALAVQPEPIAAGIFWSLALSETQLFAVESERGANAVPEEARIVSFDVTSLQRRVLLSQQDGLQDPWALLLHGSVLHVSDWATGVLYQVPLAQPRLQAIATDVGGATALSRWGGSVFSSNYRGSRVMRFEDPSLADDATADSLFDPAVTASEVLSEVPYPSGIAAWQGHVAWGTHGHNGNLDNELVVRSLADQLDTAVDVGGVVAAIDPGEDELVWASYAPAGSELSRAPVAASGAPQLEETETLLFCGQPAAAIVRGSLAIYGGPGLVLWERGDDAVQVLAGGFVRYLAANETHIYYATADGLYRIPRP